MPLPLLHVSVDIAKFYSAVEPRRYPQIRIKGGAWRRNLRQTQIMHRCLAKHPVRKARLLDRLNQLQHSLDRCSAGNELRVESLDIGHGLIIAQSRLRRLLQMRNEACEQAAPVGAAHDVFDVVFRMRHHAEHIAALADDAGDGMRRAIDIGALIDRAFR